MKIKVGAGEFSILHKGIVTVKEDVFLPTATTVKGQVVTIRSEGGAKVVIYPQEGEKIDGLPSFLLAKLCPWVRLQASWTPTDGEWLVQEEGSLV